MADQRSEPDSTWQPATSDPGELYTIEGQIRGVGAFASGLKNRARRNRHPMARVAATILGAVVLLAVVFAIVV